MMQSKAVALVYALLLTLVACFSTPAFGQQCPRPNSTGPTFPSAEKTIEGHLVFHDDIRGFFELKLDHPQCGQTSIELISNKMFNALQVFRGCHVRSTGAVDFAPSGYNSLEQFQDVMKIEPLGVCMRQPLFPDYSKERPDKSIHEYRVDMHIDYSPGDHPIEFHVTTSGRELQPWQAYASYELTGDFVLYGLCGEGFVVDKVFGTQQAHPLHFDEPRTPSDRASFDPENAAAAGIRNLHLGYSCVRQPAQ